ncbi:MAG: hypothetical protein GC191_03185 [Azospirillum sp.]|nr:hypothetical protein [Azospirillum sp.]
MAIGALGLLALDLPVRVIAVRPAAAAQWALTVDLPPSLGATEIIDAVTIEEGRCQGRWHRLAEPGASYRIDCRTPPPYRLRIADAPPLIAFTGIRVIRPEELVVDLSVPLAAGWPGEFYPDRVTRLSSVRVETLLNGGLAVPMFPDAQPGSEVDLRCRSRLAPKLAAIVSGSIPPLPVPCISLKLPIPPLWHSRIRDRTYPSVEGCLRGRDAQAQSCIIRPDQDGLITLDFGPGWQPATLRRDELSPSILAGRLRPEWPYDPGLFHADPTPTLGQLRVRSVAYCDTVEPGACCGDRAVAVDQQAGAIRELPSLAEANCPTERRLPSFAVATFGFADRNRGDGQFTRYWSIASVTGRPYRINADQVLTTYPIHVILDPAIIAAGNPVPRLVLYSSLHSCQSADGSDSGIGAYPLRSSELSRLRVGLPAFAAVQAAATKITRCAEAVVEAGSTPAATFRFIGLR